MNWQPMETAPKGGRKILVAWDTGGYGWHYTVVWWDDDCDANYPWRSGDENEGYKIDIPDVWAPLTPPVAHA
jgi:hypothetical protein